MTKYYLCRGTDTQSDNGYWDLIIEANSTTVARSIAKKFLENLGRNDLTVESCRLMKPQGYVLYSTVEQR
jgi:hypothetical protein